MDLFSVTLNRLCSSTLATEQCALTTAVLWSTLANPKVEMLLICAWAWFPSAALHYKHVQLFKKDKQLLSERNPHRNTGPNSHSTPQSDAEYRRQKNPVTERHAPASIQAIAREATGWFTSNSPTLREPLESSAGHDNWSFSASEHGYKFTVTHSHSTTDDRKSALP